MTIEVASREAVSSGAETDVDTAAPAAPLSLREAAAAFTVPPSDVPGRSSASALTPKPRAGFVETEQVRDLTRRAMGFIRAGYPLHFLSLIHI